MDDEDQRGEAATPTGGEPSPGGTPTGGEPSPGGTSTAGATPATPTEAPASTAGARTADAWVESPAAPAWGTPAAGGSGPTSGSGAAAAGDPQGQLRRGVLLGVGATAALAVVVVAGVLVWSNATDDDGGSAQPAATATAPTQDGSAPDEADGDATDDGDGTTGDEPTVVVAERALPATQVWTAMGVTCAAGDTLRIVMSGSASHDQTAAGTVGPTGLLDPLYHQFNVEGFPDANTMTVIGSLEEDPATFFVVGESAVYACPRDGELYLGVNDVGVQNNSGAFQATITHTAFP
ncbi:hypothetical protein [Cellulomonas fimi]|uniref:Uncharacterized protein n=1 Tax=Cellulomonas fimi (strain ATCC 484 / DSM 20113 / JCM 1341 / CCUG 24087 / LMG 16345 / NBRC 15513 / NCIMB 8980 / NCTC 7547 / NRS-133) TaxID=590998 RepID=F4H5Y1_CELFA|nr:hypothetical protein [Cellulomonas fimi]AEE46711.1 hypothetical protein Celf_2586 [Cellulomonas fimi ATCC 484]NNH07644.1 hypothetical protein [Cellulomonas fimi]VEH33955.1 Uncharacterised protein [Cellulomonas fimi]